MQHSQYIMQHSQYIMQHSHYIMQHSQYIMQHSQYITILNIQSVIAEDHLDRNIQKSLYQLNPWTFKEFEFDEFDKVQEILLIILLTTQSTGYLKKTLHYITSKYLPRLKYLQTVL